MLASNRSIKPNVYLFLVLTNLSEGSTNTVELLPQFLQLNEYSEEEKCTDYEYLQNTCRYIKQL